MHLAITLPKTVSSFTNPCFDCCELKSPCHKAGYVHAPHAVLAAEQSIVNDDPLLDAPKKIKAIRTPLSHSSKYHIETAKLLCLSSKIVNHATAACSAAGNSSFGQCCHNLVQHPGMDFVWGLGVGGLRCGRCEIDVDGRA